MTDHDSVFSVESIISQDDEVYLTNTFITKYIIYVWKILEYQVPNFSPPTVYVLEHLIVEEEHVLHLTLVLEDWEHWFIIALEGVPSVCLTNYLCSYVIQL